MRTPFCQACQTAHYNFQSCAEAAAKRVKDAEVERRDRNRSQPVFRDHSRAWGHRTETMQVVSQGDANSPMVVMRRRAA